MFVQKGSPFIEPFNWIVYRDVEEGLLQKYYADSRYSWRIQGMPNMSDSGGEDNSGGGYVVFNLTLWRRNYFFLFQHTLYIKCE